MLHIVKYPHPALRYPSVPVSRIDDELRAHVREMLDLMYEHRGIGLAANQVALPFRFFVLNVTADPDQKDMEQVFINPEIVKRHSSIEDEEGCLSFPGIFAPVRRSKKIRVRAYDLAGEEVEIDAEDLLSRAVQHETDHVEGRLFIDHLTLKPGSDISGKIKDLEERHLMAQRDGVIASDDVLKQMLDAMVKQASEDSERNGS